VALIAIRPEVIPFYFAPALKIAFACVALESYIREVLRMKKAGFYSESMPLEYRLSHWYTFGNIIFFGVPGWLIVDPFFGGMYTFKADKIDIWMRPCEPGPFNYMCS
jgi:hypothetical protein